MHTSRQKKSLIRSKYYLLTYLQRSQQVFVVGRWLCYCCCGYVESYGMEIKMIFSHARNFNRPNVQKQTWMTHRDLFYLNSLFPLFLSYSLRFNSAHTFFLAHIIGVSFCFLSNFAYSFICWLQTSFQQSMLYECVWMLLYTIFFPALLLHFIYLYIYYIFVGSVCQVLIYYVRTSNNNAKVAAFYLKLKYNRWLPPIKRQLRRLQIRNQQFISQALFLFLSGDIDANGSVAGTEYRRTPYTLDE